MAFEVIIFEAPVFFNENTFASIQLGTQITKYVYDFITQIEFTRWALFQRIW